MLHPLNKVTLELPAFVAQMAPVGKVLETDEERMMLAIGLAREGIERMVSGPFGAVVVDEDSGKLIGAGVNLVQWGRCSALHGEMVALSFAEANLQQEDLRLGGRRYGLYTSAQPCAMCQGRVTQWSRPSRLVISVPTERVEAITGFREGVDPYWQDAIYHADIELTEGLCQKEGEALLRRYVELDGAIYQTS